MLHIVEVQQILLPLLRIVRLLKGKHQIDQRTGRPLADLHMGQDLLLRLEKVRLPQSVQGFLYLRPERLCHLPLERIYRIVLFRWQAVKFQGVEARCDLVKSHLLPLVSGKQLFEHLLLALQKLSVKVRSVRLLTDPLRLPQLFCTVPHKPRRLFQKFPHPGQLFKTRTLFCRRRAVIAPSLLQPLLRERVTHGKVVEPAHDVLHRVIPAARAEVLHGKQKFRILRGVLLLQHLREHIRLQQLHLSLVPDPEARIQSDRVKLVAQDRQTEAVDRRDLRVVEQRCLPLQMLVFGVGRQSVIDRIADTLAHLSRRRACEGHDQKPVNVDRMLLITDHFYDPFYQNRRLARTGCC